MKKRRGKEEKAVEYCKEDQSTPTNAIK